MPHPARAIVPSTGSWLSLSIVLEATRSQKPPTDEEMRIDIVCASLTVGRWCGLGPWCTTRAGITPAALVVHSKDADRKTLGCIVTTFGSSNPRRPPVGYSTPDPTSPRAGSATRRRWRAGRFPQQRCQPSRAASLFGASGLVKVRVDDRQCASRRSAGLEYFRSSWLRCGNCAPVRRRVVGLA